MGVNTQKDVEQLVKHALRDALKYVSSKSVNNRLRSSIFVSKIGQEFTRAYIDHNIKYVDFDEKLGKRVAGEWLLDVAIVKETEVLDSKYNSKAKMPVQLIWAVESESDTSLAAFAEDFGKLLSVRSENYLFLNGLNQKTSSGRADYIKRRCALVENIMTKTELSYTNFYLAFWPSPAKKDDVSYWDQSSSHSDLVDMVDVYKLKT